MFDSLLQGLKGEPLRLLVTGGAGFIGSNFVRRTLESHPEVQLVVLDALTYAGRLSNLEGLEGRFEFVEGNILDEDLVERLVSSCEQVVHFAAESHNDNSLKSPNLFVETNVIGTLTLIQACVKQDVAFHHVSTDEVFGDLPLEGEEKFTRDTPYNPSSPYSASKAASDHLVRAWVRSFGLRATISNCSNNFGPYQHEEKLIPRMIRLIASGQRPELYGSGMNVRDWIHVDDHNDGVWAVLERGKVGQTYLLGADNQRTNIDVAKSILKLMDKPEDFISFIEDRAGHDLRYAIDASATEQELNWRPKRGNFEQRLKETIAFYTRSF
jgi:dTDP-glucose 4,6-dehydratase